MSQELLMDLYFKPRRCTTCGKEAEPVTGEFFAGGEVYKVHFSCKHCNTGFSKLFGNVRENYEYGGE